MTYFMSILMGIIQGVAEFLPISSSGHLALFQTFFGMENMEEKYMFFTVLLHFGTLISVCMVYWRDIVDMIREFFLGIAALAGRKDTGVAPPPARRMVMLIIIATVPLFVMVFLQDAVNQLFSNSIMVSCALLATGFILFFSDRMARGHKTAKNATVADALIVGCGQALAVIPGLSSSGTTISVGMMRGFDRAFAVQACHGGRFADLDVFQSLHVNPPLLVFYSETIPVSEQVPNSVLRCSADHNAIRHRPVECQAAFLDLYDQVACDLVDHGHFAVHHKTKLCQMQADFIFAGDLLDGDGLARLRHCQRHHNIPLPFSYCLWAADAPERLVSRNYQHR